ncbi:hypothetical protein O9929_04770 [Vibrio lentus]|nr:hypothetical protein [Vibrio lentus]
MVYPLPEQFGRRQSPAHKYRYSDIPEFQPEFNAVSEEEQKRDALADLFSRFQFDQQDDLIR